MVTHARDVHAERAQRARDPVLTEVWPETRVRERPQQQPLLAVRLRGGGQRLRVEDARRHRGQAPVEHQQRRGEPGGRQHDVARPRGVRDPRGDRELGPVALERGAAGELRVASLPHRGAGERDEGAHAEGRE
jgi:hypothetical protein